MWLLYLTILINLDLPTMLNTQAWWLWTIAVLWGGAKVTYEPNRRNK